MPTSNANPEERRVYISNVVAFPERDASVFRKARKEADDYLTANVVAPLKAKGILHQYYDDAISINNKVVYSLDTRSDVEKVREEALRSYKEQNANVFTFYWTRDGEAKGLETAQPTLIQHSPKQPLYGASEAKPTQPKTVEPAQNPSNATSPPKNRPVKKKND